MQHAFLIWFVGLASGGPLPRVPDVMVARALEGSALAAELFDRAWLLPEAAPEAVQADAQRSGPGLVAELKRLAALREGAAPWPGAGEGAPRLALGDLLLRGRAAPRGEGWLEGLLAEASKEAPLLSEAAAPYLLALLDDVDLHGPRWDPDSERSRDGILLAEPWDVVDAAGKPWRGLRGKVRMQRAITVIFADLEAIKEAENDYLDYPSRAGASYRWIGAVPGSYVRGMDDALGSYSALRLRFRCDLPFPFSGYTCDLRILNRLDADGHLVTDIYSTSGDFHWLAGRDVFIPVRTAGGEWVATLVVRLFGFDLDGVPDRDSHRRAALRGSLGNLKREAEARFAERGSKPRTVEGGIPAFRVRGLRD